MLGQVAALRLYTTSTYTLVNNPLRASGGKLSEELRSSRHPLAVTTAHITKGLKKLRALNFNDIEDAGATRKIEHVRGLEVNGNLSNGKRLLLESGRETHIS